MRVRVVAGVGMAVWALGAAAAGAMACGHAASSSHTSPPDASPPGADATTQGGSGTLTGVVTDLTGHAVAGVRVAVGSRSINSAADGTYTLPGLATGSKVVATYTAAGYSDTAEPVTLGPGASQRQDVVLVALGTSLPLDATAGGTVSGPRGASLTAGPGVFVDGAGHAVSGSVSVYLTPLDPVVAQELAAYPGALLGVDGSGATQLLETYGVLDVTVMQGGQKLQIAKGKTVTVSIPASAAGGTPAQTDLWSFDATSGIWQHEGTTTLSGATYTAQLPHLSFWNVDAAFAGGGCLTGRVVDSTGAPVLGAIVTPSGVGYTLFDEVPSGDSVNPLMPQYCVWAKPSAQVRLTATTASFATGVQTGSVVTMTGPGIPYVSGMCPANCIQVPDIVIGKDQILSDAGPSSCLTSPPPADGGAGDAGAGDGAAGNPFAGTCAANLSQFAQCYSAGATGACSTQVNLGGDSGTFISTTSYAGGSSVQVTSGPTGSFLSFDGPGQTSCGSAMVNPRTHNTTLSLPSGQTFVMDPGGSIVCPDGTVIALTPAQSSAVSGCQSLGAGCQGGPVDGGGASVACVISKGGGSTVCLVYENLTPAQVTQQQSFCGLATGQVVATCPTPNLQGCCTTTTAGGTTKTCYYSGTPTQLQAACTAQAGTWSTN